MKHDLNIIRVVLKEHVGGSAAVSLEGLHKWEYLHVLTAGAGNGKT